MDLRFLHPYFLGPHAENGQLLEQLLLEFVRDHAFWRRNFHPEDSPPIPANAQYQEEYQAFVSRMHDELRKLSAELKRAVPFFSPRYVGHMSSDLLLPGLIAKLITSLYNPNNVAEEAAPVTLEKELQVGIQLARMFGFACDEGSEPCAWGHLTSGGTVANYEALWNLRSVKLYPVALAAAARRLGLDFDGVGPKQQKLSAYSKWELVNLSVDDTIALRRRCAGLLRQAGTTDLATFAQAVRAERIETLGTADFFLRHRELAPPRVLVSVAGHYSWEKAMKVLGLGTAQLIKTPVDANMRLSIPDLEALLEAELGQERSVLAVVGILGTTEFGTVDPIHDILAVRRSWRRRGCDFGVHVDAAWGGYLASVFRKADGGLWSRAELRKEFHYFPSEVMYNAFTCLGEVDSITVDPHKLGYVPYAAGAFVARNREVVDFITQKAAYVFDLGSAQESIPTGDKLRNLGMYILEGSKAGAAAASVYVTHNVLPLHRDGFGRLMQETVRACEYFFDTTREMQKKLAPLVSIAVPFTPDSNLICLAINPRGNRATAVMNRFGRRLFAAMKVDARQPVQMKEFIGSYTSLFKDSAMGAQADRILTELGVDPATFTATPTDPEHQADHVFMLRHTLMNPWLRHADGARNYIDRYWAYLEQLIGEALRGG